MPAPGWWSSRSPRVAWRIGASWPRWRRCRAIASSTPRWPQRLRRPAAAHRPRPDDLAALHRGLHDRAAARSAGRHVCSKSAPAAAIRPPSLGEIARAGLHHRDRQGAGRRRHATSRRSRLHATSPSATATATAAGPTRRPLTASSWRPRQTTCRRRWWRNWPWAAGWCMPVGDDDQEIRVITKTVERPPRRAAHPGAVRPAHARRAGAGLMRTRAAGCAGTS